MLLSRVAESLYWINRYLERAENISRFVEVSEAMSLDCPPGSAEPVSYTHLTLPTTPYV